MYRAGDYAYAGTNDITHSHGSTSDYACASSNDITHCYGSAGDYAYADSTHSYVSTGAYPRSINIGCERHSG